MSKNVCGFFFAKKKIFIISIAKENTCAEFRREAIRSGKLEILIFLNKRLSLWKSFQKQIHNFSLQNQKKNNQ